MAAKKIAIITGGNRGIGLEIARQLMKEDIFVVIVDRVAPTLDLVRHLLAEPTAATP